MPQHYTDWPVGVGVGQLLLDLSLKAQYYS